VTLRSVCTGWLLVMVVMLITNLHHRQSRMRLLEHAGRSSQPGTFTNGSAIYPVKEEVPDLAVPLYKDGTGEEGLTAVAECQDDNTLLKDLSAVKVTKVCVNQYKKVS